MMKDIELIATTSDAPTPGKQDRFRRQAEIILEGLGGPENIKTLDNCVSRLRLEMNDMDKVNEAKIKSAGVPAINKVSDENLHVIVGTEVQFVADELHKMI